MQPARNPVIDEMNRFEKKRILKVCLESGSVLAVSTLLAFPLLALAEYYFYLSPQVKTGALLLYAGVSVSVMARFVLLPWWQLRNTREIPQFEKLSRRISARFREVDDKLLNYLQLLSMSMGVQSGNRLVELSLAQREGVIRNLRLPERIRLRLSPSWWRWLLPAGLAGLAIWVGFFDFVRQGSERLLHPGQAYAPPAPFTLVFSGLPERVMANQTLSLCVKASGPQVPAQVFVRIGSRTVRLRPDPKSGFCQTIDNLEAGSFPVTAFSGAIESEVHKLEVLPPGQIRSLRIRVEPPAYTGLSARSQENEGNLDVPAGSSVTWEMETENLISAGFQWGEKPEVAFGSPAANRYLNQLQVREGGFYRIRSRNALGRVDQQFEYQVSVREDELPRISVRAFQDSGTLSRQYFGGQISDDYGFTRLRAVFLDASTRKTVAEVAIPLTGREKNQTFVFTPDSRTGAILREKPLALVFRVWDNDGVAGPKMASSALFDLGSATRESMQESVSRMDTRNEEKLEDLVRKTENLERNSRKLMESLKGKRDMSWQDKKEVENYLEKQKDLFSQLEQLRKEAENVLKNKEENQLVNPELLEKQEKINQMLDEILDEKTREMLRELERLLEQSQNKDQLQEALEKMEDKNEFIQNELDRAMEMLKQLKLEEKLGQSIEKLEKLAEEQEKAGEQNESKGDKQSAEDKQKAREEQERLSEEFRQLQEDVREMEKMNKELKDPNSLDTGKEDEEGADKDQQQSEEQMKDGKMQKAGSKQKSAASKMKKMAGKMKKAQMDMQGGGADKEDIGDLRSIIENLLELSFGQEDVYKQVAKVNQLDPRYLALTQKQLKIQDDAQIIKDSLKALAMRVPDIQSFVMKELYAMDDAIGEAVTYVKARRPDVAASRGQMAMTSINNLTVMLKDALQQMQDQQQSQSSGGKACKKPGKGKPKPGSMSQMQKQLNDQISQLKNGKKSGQQMSEELARLAQKQAAMRRALAELEKSMQKGKDKSGGLADIKAQMERTERELLSKKITPETIMRQQQILTRLLESEKAMMEREQDQRREAEQAKSTERTTLPPDLKNLLQKARSQKEQLLQGNPKLTETYQQAFDHYIESIQDAGL